MGSGGYCSRLCGLVQFAVGEVVFVEAEVVAEFVEEGAPYFFAVEVGVLVGVVPDIVQVENYLGGEVVCAGVGIGVGFADEEAEGVGFDLFGLYGGGWDAFVEDGDAVGFGAEGCGQGAEGVLDFLLGGGEEVMEVWVGLGHVGLEDGKGWGVFNQILWRDADFGG